MRIAYLTSQYPGTTHTFIRREVFALRQLGVDVQTFSVRAPPPSQLVSPVDREEDGRTFTVFRRSALSLCGTNLAELLRRPLRCLKTLSLALKHRAPGAKNLLLAGAHYAEAIVLAAELRRRGISHLHNHFANSGATVGLLASRHVDILWSFTIHGISEFDYPAGLLLGEKIERAAFVACVSYFGRAQAYRLVDSTHWPKLTVVRCGLLLNELPKLTKAAAAGERLRLILVGRLSAEKGIDGLLEALASIDPAQRPELVVVGDGPMAELLGNRVHQLGLQSQVSFRGRLPEAETLAEIARSDMLVLTSFMEGLPIVLMEAMALGKAVIATRVAGIPELVEDGKTGLLFTPSRWSELAEQIRLLATDKDLRRRLEQAGPIRIAQEFDVSLSAVQLRDLFQKAAQFVSKPVATRNEQA